MRQFITVPALLLLSGQLCAQKEPIQINSKIEKVTVFLKGAQVERNAKQVLTPGKYDIEFSGISPNLDKQSIQLKVGGKLTVLSVTHQLNFLKEQQARDEIRQTEVQKDGLLERMNTEKNMQNVFRQEEQMILKNQSIKGDNSTLKAAELKEAVDFQRQRLTEVYQKLQENENNLKKINIEIDKLDKQLKSLNEKKDLSTSEIVVSVDVKEPGPVDFHLTYLVMQASWFPTYDIRVNNIKSPLLLQMKANINQQSGEDWKDVRLFLSTGDPNENGTKPSLIPWYLRYYYASTSSPLLIRGISTTGSLQGQVAGVVIDARQSMPGQVSGVVRDDKGIPVAGATITAKGTDIGTVTDNSGTFSIAMPSTSSTLTISSVGYAAQEITANRGFANIVLNRNESRLEEVVTLGYTTSADQYDYSTRNKISRQREQKTEITTTTSYQPTMTIFEIVDVFSVPGDGKVHTTDIESHELNAFYEYYSAPKMDVGAYLTAKITDWQQLNLLPGQANLFFEGTYLGNSLLDVGSAGDTLNISLGQDKGVVIKRTLNKEFSQKKFLGGNKTDSREYEISIRNNKAEVINIIIEDQFPISTNKDVTVEKLSYDGGKLDEDSRKISWIQNVPASTETKLQMAYSVKYPREKILQLE